MEFIIKYGVELALGSVGSLLLGWILAKIPTGKWAKQLSELGEKNGKTLTTFCRKKIPLWNKVIEPVFIDTLAVIPAYVAGLIRGLKSDGSAFPFQESEYSRDCQYRRINGPGYRCPPFARQDRRATLVIQQAVEILRFPGRV